MRLYYLLLLLINSHYKSEKNIPKHSLYKKSEKQNNFKLPKFKLPIFRIRINIPPMLKLFILVLIVSIIMAVVVFTFAPTLDSGAWYRQIYLK